MIKQENKKKIIVLVVIFLFFILLLLFAYVFKKDEVQSPVEVPIGKHGHSDELGKEIDTYITIDEGEIELKETSAELKYILKNPKVNLRDFGEFYIYDGYYVFPDRKIKIKKSYDQILSLVFFNDYAGNVIDDIGVNTTSFNITSKLGNPNYNNEGFIIYKTKRYYVIFNTDLKQVSVYFRTSPDLMIFWNLYQIYKDTNNLKTFISDLTNYYPSYTNYIYDTNGLELVYADFGIRLYFKQNDLRNGIYIYSNYENNGNEKYSLDNLIKNYKVYYKNQNLIVKEEIERLIYEEEKRNFSVVNKIYSDNEIYKNINVLESYANKKIEKIIDEKTKKEIIKEYKELANLSKYKIYYELNNNRRYTFSNVSVISKIGNNHYNINTAKVADYLLLTEDYLFYSIKNEGIFRMNINNGKVIELYIGAGNFELKFIKSNYLYYDDTKVKAF